jgi:hypothetical protein
MGGRLVERMEWIRSSLHELTDDPRMLPVQEVEACLSRCEQELGTGEEKDLRKLARLVPELLIDTEQRVEGKSAIWLAGRSIAGRWMEMMALEHDIKTMIAKIRRRTEQEGEGLNGE